MPDERATSPFSRVTVLGLGVLGAQIALQTAAHGIEVTAFDVDDDALRAGRGRLDAFAAAAAQDLPDLADILKMVKAAAEGADEIQGDRFITSEGGGIIIGKDGEVAGRVPAGSFVDAKSGRPRHVPLDRQAAAFFAAVCAGRAAGETMLLREDGRPWGTSHQQRPRVPLRGLVEATQP